jgi:integrase
MGNNAVMKHIERLRKMINMAVRMEWIEKDPFSLFKAKFIKKGREFLSKDELDAIEQRDFEIERLQQVKDIFVFSCYTGLAYLKEIADLCRINKNLTFHIARHTFATTVNLSNGVPIVSVSKMLGHTDLRTTQIYAKVVEKTIIE